MKNYNKTEDQLKELLVEYRRYRRACVKKGKLPVSFSKWLPKEEIVAEPIVEAPKKTKAKKEEKTVILDDIFELTPEEPEEPKGPTDIDDENTYFK